MIKVENDMLVLDNSFTKEDVQAIDQFVKINVDKKISGIIELIEDEDTWYKIHETYKVGEPAVPHIKEQLLSIIKENK